MLKSSKNPIEAIRFIATKQSESTLDLAEIIKDFDVEPEYRVIPQEKIDVLVENFRSSERAQEYMESRGFIPETASHFEVGYDPSQDMVVVPIHDLRGNVIGVNGRSVQGKRFKLSKNIERNKILFNLHRARRMGGTAIVFESQFDVMKVHQAGFPNGVCFFGSHVSREQVSMLQRYFDRIIIMTDADEAGRKAGHNISGLLKNKKVEWAIYDWGVIYPHGAKDAGDLSEEEIRYCVNNSVSDVAYKSYKQLAHTARV